MYCTLSVGCLGLHGVDHLRSCLGNDLLLFLMLFMLINVF